VRWIHCIEYVFFIIQTFEQLALALKIFTPLKYFLSFRIFEELALALKTEFSLKFFTALKIVFTFRVFEQLVLALKIEFALNFSIRGGGRPPRPPASYVTACTVNCKLFFKMKRTATKFEWLEKKEKNNSENFSKFYWLSSSALCKSIYLNQFFCLLCIQAVSDVGPHQTIYWKNTLYSAQLAGHVHKLDVKLQFVWKWLFSVCCAHSCQTLPLWSELTNNALRK